MEEIKIACRKCKEEKSESEMKREPRGKFGFQKICRNCENDRHKKYRESQKETEEWKEKERQRHKKYNQEHKEEIKERQKVFREVHKNEFFACELCQLLIKNKIVHEKSEDHLNNSNNGWKDDKEKKNAEHFQPRIMELKKMFKVWQNDLKKEKELKDIEEEHTKAENEYKEQQRERKRERDRQYYLARKEKKKLSAAEKMEGGVEEGLVF